MTSTTAQMLADAKHIAMEQFYDNVPRGHRRAREDHGKTLLGWEGGTSKSTADGGPYTRPIFRIVLAPENTASENALARALLGSAAISVQNLEAERGRQRVAYIGEACEYGATFEDALAALLDRLLPAPSDARAGTSSEGEAPLVR